MVLAALAGGLAMSGRTAGLAAGPASTKPAFTVGLDGLRKNGINPALIVAVHISDGGKLVVVAEHRPGKGSYLHVFDGGGSYLYGFPVPSPQLVDFYIDAAGESAFLIGSLGTRFYSASLKSKRAELVFSSLPDRPGFRALTPVTIVQSPEGPAVYGLFYKNEKVSRDLGFALIDELGKPRNLMSTLGWESRFGRVVSYVPQPEFEGILLVHADKGPADVKAPKAPQTRRLSYAPKKGEPKELDSAEDIFGVTWAPDGRSAYYVRRKGKAGQLMMRLLSSGQSVVLADGRYFAPKLLANRRMVVSKFDDKAQQTVWTLEVPAGAAQQLDIPGPTAFYSSDPSGTAIAAWGPWGISTFRFPSGS
ncbi:MAG: hypothetical protein HY553_00750 [Elusimicrobia bacterium]|nr:hypothetical protein [Elusimicrobiota bacterium]